MDNGVTAGVGAVRNPGGSKPMTDQQLERLARYTPAFILGYFVIQFIIRIGFSANLETDEAQFVGHTYFALGYGNSHPPLYNWLVAAALQLTGGHWPSAVALVKTIFLAGAYLLAFDTLRRVTGRALPGLIIATSFLLIPQIVWKSQITLAHSVMVMFAVVALVHAVICVAQRGGLLDFVWLGIAASIGALAKYNFFLMLAAVLAAVLTIAPLRERVFRPKLVFSILILGLSFGPHLIWAAQHWRQTTQRMAKLERTDSLFYSLDLPWIGVDGFLSTLVAILAWAGPLLLVWWLILYLSVRNSDLRLTRSEAQHREFCQFFGRTTLFGLALFGAIVLAGDLNSVHERYMTPILIVLPFWLALSWPLESAPRAPTHFLRLGMIVALLMMTAWPAWMVFGKEQFAYPYSSFAADLRRLRAPNSAILANRDKIAANLAIRLDQTHIWNKGMQPDRVIVVWSGKSQSPPDSLANQLGNAYQPQGDTFLMRHPYDNFSSIEARLSAQLYARKP